MKMLSVVIPVYNEAKTILKILAKIDAVGLDKEIVIVDNSSSDGTVEVLKGLGRQDIKCIFHDCNKGKGTSVREGIEAATSEFVVIQDADLEYDPADFLKLLEPLKKNEADIVLGARFTSGHSGLLAHRLGNRFLTWLLNLLFGSRLNDYATCYKMARKSVFDGLKLRAGGFDIEVEIVCKALKKKLRIIEVPISYYPRSYREGKKIRWFDGLDAIKSILKYRFSD
ncbi:MAG: glycosyltransferase family 2 protein [Candidatus Omnitrophica bacterium]|nr:glycosyltransferase family 2 protein [Candidatus Omnitrophota bacterium]MDD5236614.1 glycosyltransferase family 2 protein [Candidatus Omnitrophota bacterium]MDD5610185.1 glycosyltransferase family 2 protein [Candidatus Omnitrophota bacterium]